jgi:hypothetical protein
MSIISGLWHQAQFMLHPCKNTVVRIPGPSLSENLWMLVMNAVTGLLLATIAEFPWLFHHIQEQIRLQYKNWAEIASSFCIQQPALMVLS